MNPLIIDTIEFAFSLSDPEMALFRGASWSNAMCEKDPNNLFWRDMNMAVLGAITAFINFKREKTK